MTDMMAIANAAAGSSDDATIAAVVDVLAGAGGVRLVRTSDADDLAAALRDIGDRTAVVLGGDGSLHAVVAALDKLGALSTTPVALVPMGTGNDFARTLGLSEDPLEAAHQAIASAPRPIDLVRDGEGRLVVNAAHVGVGAEAAANARRYKKRWGRLGYAIGTLMASTSPGVRLHIEIDGVTLPSRGPVVQVAVGNGRFVGGGTPLLPEADPTDGKLDVAVSWADSAPSRLGYVLRLRAGRHPTRPDVQYERARLVSVSGEPTRVTLDGELHDPTTQHRWELLPAAMLMRYPMRAE